MRTIEHVVPAEVADNLERIAALKGRDPQSGRDEIIWQTEVKIDDDHLVDVKLCNGHEDSDTPWVDRVLFERNGEGFSEIGCLDPTDSVFEAFEFKDLDVRIEIKRGEPTNSPKM